MSLPRRVDDDEVADWIAASESRQDPTPVIVMFTWAEVEATIERLRRSHPARAKHAAKVLEWFRKEAEKLGCEWAQKHEGR